MEMDERNCGLCKPCAAGRYNECEMRKEEILHNAAPELLEALKSILPFVDGYKAHSADILEKARYAIAKATGSV
jgi:Zn-dependent alcohol dehydrogenase